MKIKNTINDFELEIDSRELTRDELLEIKDFIQKDKDKNIDQFKIQKTILKRNIKKRSRV